MSHRQSQAARHTQELLEDLECDKELDVIRIYLIRYDLFPRTRDPKMAPIRSEELRDLVKYWKLHRQRNFWKNHTTKEDLVRMLYKYITTKILPTENKNENIIITPARPSSSNSILNIDSPSKIRRTSKFIPSNDRNKINPLGIYGGDLFTQRGDYDSGMIYVSRLAPPGSEIIFQEDRQDTIDTNIKDLTNYSIVENLDEDATQREKRLMGECACSLYQLTLEPGHEGDIVREGCIPAIVRMCTFDDIDVKKYCSATIVNISVDGSLTPRLLEEGVVGGLMELAKVQQEDIRRNAAIGICRISYDRQGQQKLIQEGTVPALISMLNNTDSETKEACVKTLVNISSFSGSVVSESVTHTITRIASKKDPAYNRFLIETICDMSLLSGPRAKAADDGILEPIYEINKGTFDIDIKRMIATALSNFSGIETNHQHMCNGRTLHAIDSLFHIDDVDIKLMAATAISNLSCSPDYIDNLLATYEDTFNLPLRLIQSGYNTTDSIQESISGALLKIALSHDTNRIILTQNGVVLLLIHFFQTSSYLTKKHAVVLLCALISNDISRAQLVQHEVIKVVIMLAADSTTRELCAIALFNFSCYDDMSPYLLAPQVLQPLIQLLSSTPVLKDNSEKEISLTPTQEFALSCIYNLSFSCGSAEFLIQAKTVQSIASVFRKTCKNSEANLRAAAALCNMSFCSSIELLGSMLDDDVLKLIKRLTSHSTAGKELLLACTTTLCNLALYAMQAHHQMLVNLLIEYSHTPHPDIAFVCAISFSKLASNPSMRENLSKNIDLPPTLTVMMRSGIEQVQIHCAAALCGLACERGQKGNRHMWKEGTITDFIVNSLLRINSDSTKEVCARVLFNVLIHEDCRGHMIKDGVLYALVKLARLDSLEIRTLCVTALYNLSCDDTMISVLMDINVAHVISKMCESEFNHVENRRRLAACLTNIALHPGYELKLMEGGGLTAVLLLCDHGDVECMRYGASVLCSLSTMPANCDGMASIAALELLLKMVNSSDSYQCIFALHAICNISCIPALHDKIEEAETICTIVRVLGEAEEADILFTCSKILCNMAFHAKHHTTILKHNYIPIVLQTLKRNFIQSVGDVSARIIATLSEDNSVLEILVACGAVEILHMASRAGDETTVIHCIISMCRLSRGGQSCGRIILDGLFDILNSAVPLTYNDKIGPKLTTDMSERCSIILRTLSTFTMCIPDLVADSRLMQLATALAFDGDKETCRHIIMLIHNITAARSREFQREARRSGVIPLLIKLARVCTKEELQICAVSLAHISSELSEAERREIEVYDKGLVHTMVSMLEMDPPAMQRLERVALLLPTPLAIARFQTDFLTGENATRVLTNIPVQWHIQSASTDESSMIPREAKTFLSTLPQKNPDFELHIKEDLFGSFQILQVTNEKSKMKLVPPRSLMSMTSIMNIVDVNVEQPHQMPMDAIDILEEEPLISAPVKTPQTPRHHTPSTPGTSRVSDDEENDENNAVARKPNKGHKMHGRSSKANQNTKPSTRKISLTKAGSSRHIKTHDPKNDDSYSSILPKI